MGKDFRVGLITGVVLAVAALIWVATRPSLSPQARVAADVPGSSAQDPALRDAQRTAGPEQASPTSLPWQELSAVVDRTWRTQAAQGASASPGPSSRVEPQAPEGTPVVNEPTAAEPLPQPSLPDLTIYEQAEPIKTTRFCIVQRGDTLSGIAQRYYGSANQWRKIVAANQKAIKDPNKIAPGTKLIIPE